MASHDERSAKEKDQWAELTPAEQAAATTLGYTTLWNVGDVPEQCTRVWAALSPAEVGAGIVLGYTAAEWDAEATGAEAPSRRRRRAGVGGGGGRRRRYGAPLG